MVLHQGSTWYPLYYAQHARACMCIFWAVSNVLLLDQEMHIILYCRPIAMNFIENFSRSHTYKDMYEKFKFMDPQVHISLTKYVAPGYTYTVGFLSFYLFFSITSKGVIMFPANWSFAALILIHHNMQWPRQLSHGLCCHDIFSQLVFLVKVSWENFGGSNRIKLICCINTT